MLLDAIGIDQTQEEQVEKLFGKIINQGAGGDFSLASQALKGSYLKRDGKKIYVYPYFSYCSRPNPNDFNVIVNHLERGIPLVMATIHHGRLCVGIDIIMSGSQRQIVNFRMLDPAIGAGSQILDMSIQEWKQQGMGFMTIDY
jgi:hypothetical protein